MKARKKVRRAVAVKARVVRHGITGLAAVAAVLKFLDVLGQHAETPDGLRGGIGYARKQIATVFVLK